MKKWKLIHNHYPDLPMYVEAETRSKAKYLAWITTGASEFFPRFGDFCTNVNVTRSDKEKHERN